jgi:protein phosphatase PTC7
MILMPRFIKASSRSFMRPLIPFLVFSASFVDSKRHLSSLANFGKSDSSIVDASLIDPTHVSELPLSFISSATNLVSPEKVKRNKLKKSEDAFFTSRYSLGVADGVGGFEDIGIDSGEFSRNYMENVKQLGEDKFAHIESHIYTESIDGKDNALDAKNSSETHSLLVLEPKQLMSDAFYQVKSQGGSTSVITTLSVDHLLRIYNFGDSGALIIRPHKPASGGVPYSSLSIEESSKLNTLLFKSNDIVHAIFNMPYQIGMVNDRYDGEVELGDQYTFAIQPNDLVLLVSDGVLDNLYGQDILQCVSKFDLSLVFKYSNIIKYKLLQEEKFLKQKLYEENGGKGKLIFSHNSSEFPVLSDSGVEVTDFELEELEKSLQSLLLSLSASVAMKAQTVSLNANANTPWNDYCKLYGAPFTGGKVDDICVVAAAVVPDINIPMDISRKFQANKEQASRAIKDAQNYTERSSKLRFELAKREHRRN